MQNIALASFFQKYSPNNARREQMHWDSDESTKSNFTFYIINFPFDISLDKLLDVTPVGNNTFPFVSEDI